MAYSRIAAATIAKYVKKLSDAYTEDSPLLRRIPKKFNEGGKHIEWRVRKQITALKGGLNDMEEVIFQRANYWAEPQLDYKMYYTAFAVSEQEKQRNKGPQQIFPVLKAEVDAAIEDIEQKVADMLYTTSGSDDKLFDGLASFIGGNSGSYAGISQSSNSYWQSQNLDATASSKSWSSDAEEHLTKMALLCSRGSRRKAARPNLAIMPRTQWEVFHDLVKERQRFMTTQADGGFGGIKWNGMDVEWEDSCTSAVVYVLNTNKLSFHSTYPRLFVTKMEDRISPLATVGLVVVFGNLRCEVPRYHGRIHTTGT